MAMCAWFSSSQTCWQVYMCTRTCFFSSQCASASCNKSTWIGICAKVQTAYVFVPPPTSFCMLLVFPVSPTFSQLNIQSSTWKIEKEFDFLLDCILLDALRDKCSSRSDLFQNAKSKYFTFSYFSTLFGSLGIDINQKLGCDSFQKEFMIF